ncbi:MAG: hypothetical protein ACJ795_07600, partial [Ktedonobacteraceae bacterium]
AGDDATTFCLSTLIITNQIPPGNSSPGINSTNLIALVYHRKSSKIRCNYSMDEIEDYKKNVR